MRVAEFVRCGAEIALDAPIPARATVCVLDASFNPPTVAHVALGRACLREYPSCTLVFLLATGNVDKPAAPPAQLDARAAMIEAVAATEFAGADVRVALTSCAQFVDKARAVHCAVPGARIVFAVGWDTLVRIGMQKYYARPVRDVLAAFFAQAELLVLTRAADPGTAMAMAPPVAAQMDLQDTPFAPFVDRVRFVLSDAATAQVSSSRARKSREALLASTPPAVGRYAIEHSLYENSN